MNTLKTPQAASRAALLVGILLIAANLRAPITALAPVLAPLRADFGLSTAAAGALTTLPLLAFALVSPFGAWFARQYGLERSLFGALLAIVLGIGLRSAGPEWSLYAGTALIGMGIAVGNVLLPSLVKRDFPRHVTSLTGSYALAMGIAAALASTAAVPMAHAWGWRWALAALAILPLAALAVWMTQAGAQAPQAAAATTPAPDAKVWNSALAWQVTLFLGLNSTIYYVAIGWLPTILIDAGFAPAQAGSQHGLLQLATAVPGLLLGPLLSHMRDQRLPAAAVALLSAIALLGLMLMPQLAWVWSILFGMGTGAGIILGLSFIGLRTHNAHQAAALSGMSQSVGYLLAATGPMAMGALHDAQGSWHIPLGICAVLALIAAVMGFLAGRDRALAQ